MGKVKMSDIAQKLGVSNVTVSKALAGKDGVSEELRARIKAVAQEMGYTRTARGERRTRTVGIVVAGAFFDPDPSCYWAIYQRLVEALKRNGYYSMLEIYRMDEQPHLPDFLLGGKVDGIVVLGYLPGALLQLLLELELPLVQMDNYSNELESVCVTPDNLRASRQLTDHLIERGHRRIGFVGSTNEMNHIQDRFLGYYKALLKAGLPAREDWVLEDRDDLTIRTEYTLPQDMPTAFVCNCDQTAFHLVNTLTRSGYRVPEDVSVIGFYDFDYATLCNTKLTTYAVDFERMANATVAILHALIGGEPVHANTVLIGGRLIERDSVAALE